MPSIIVGTAGHIDHGKSALVRALTGVDPDRLPEEKKRGITIDLGFADLELGDVRVGFVDVPGHERFIKNMLAGAHGIDLVILVVAADEGVMPQTREHFDICRLLDVRRGLIAITKTDLVEPELLPLVREEIAELVAGSALESAPVVEVSARTGVGLDELRTLLQKLAAEVPARSNEVVTRLPIDRAFGMKGFGAVVTGTLISGEIKEGDELELSPNGLRVRVRGVQVHGQSVSHAIGGQRTAVNLGGIDTAAIERGMLLGPAGRLQPLQIVDVEIDVLKATPRPLKSRARVRIHIGAAEVLGRLVVLEENGIVEPGAKGFAQLRLESPVVALPGDRFILRSYSPSVTIAGGRVLDPFAAKHRRKDLEEVRARLVELGSADHVRQLLLFVSSAGTLGMKRMDLLGRTGWTDETATAAIAEAKGQEKIKVIDEMLIGTADFVRLCETALKAINQHHVKEPLTRGLARETLRDQFFGHTAPEIFRAVIAALEDQEKIIADKDLLRSAEHSLELSGADLKLRDALQRAYEAAGFELPSIDDAFAKAQIPPAEQKRGRRILQVLIDSGTLIRVQPDLFIHRNALNRLVEKLRTFADAHEPERAIDVPAFKELTGVSRKYAIPLLEYLDGARVTVRRQDRRIVLRAKSEPPAVAGE